MFGLAAPGGMITFIRSVSTGRKQSGDQGRSVAPSAHIPSDERLFGA